MFAGSICQDPTPLHYLVGLDCKSLGLDDKMAFVLCGFIVILKITTERSNASFSLIDLTYWNVISKCHANVVA